tara:strand:+ start:1862 stop:2068 length:207 start_codon:yes stop_codon:yes gene_type:complete
LLSSISIPPEKFPPDCVVALIDGYPPPSSMSQLKLTGTSVMSNTKYPSIIKLGPSEDIFAYQSPTLTL